MSEQLRPDQVSVDAEPTPEPTPEEAARLRLQLNRDLAMWEGAGLPDRAELVRARLAELPEEEVEVEVEAEEVEEGDTGTGRYEDRTVAQLRSLAESKGLPTSGTKAELIEMLREA
jgi:SAP domain